MSDMGQLSPGTKVDRYEVVRLIGAGGMGEVYMALHEFTKKTVALKVLKITHAAKEHHVEKMRAEAMVLCRIRHNNLVEVYDAGIADVETNSGPHPLIWMAMELLEGESLRERLLREGALRPALALEWVAQCADGVQAAHDAGVIHRDLKPENIFITKKGDIRVLDFGTAKFEGFGHRKTTTNERVGTVPYMSPEHLGDEPLDGRTDVYALGLILYEMLAGRHPFSDERGAFPPMNALIGMQLGAEPESLAHHVGEQVWQLLIRAFAKERNQRFATMTELAQACRTAAAAYGESGALRLSGSNANLAVPVGVGTGPHPTLGSSQQTPAPLARSGEHAAPQGVTAGALAGMAAFAAVLGAALVFLLSGPSDAEAEASAADTGTPAATGASSAPAETTAAATSEPTASAGPSTEATSEPTSEPSVDATTQPTTTPTAPPPTTPRPTPRPRPAGAGKPPCNPDEPFPLVPCK
jgi:serine/threonine-protein kinase